MISSTRLPICTNMYLTRQNSYKFTQFQHPYQPMSYVAKPMLRNDDHKFSATPVKNLRKNRQFWHFLKKYFKLLIKIENYMPMGLDFIRFIGKSLTNTKILGWPPILHVRQPASFHGFLCLIKKDALINDYLVVSPLKSYNW